ncbi:MAG: hypothetical protein M1825_004177 [Sarcosagium campestre]|nr:MAG: hypothetical protein M1825_004177 [Sarcosagium campestre]
MAESSPTPHSIPISKSEPNIGESDHPSSSLSVSAIVASDSASSTGESSPGRGDKTPTGDSSLDSSPIRSAAISRNSSFNGRSLEQDEWDAVPLDKVTIFDFLENLALPQRIEKFQNTISAQKEKVRRHRERLKSSGLNAKDRVVEEWRRRLPPPEEQLDRYRKTMRESVDRLGQRWNDSMAVTTKEKASFIAGVLNVFISGYLIGAWPEYMYIWYTLQLCYFMPIRYYSYHKRGYHYFLADLCYFTNLLALMSIWVFPHSKRLFISTYCLAYGNNAVAIAMWRNSMVFHSLDKVTSLFIHIMPPVVLHCLVHLIPAELQKAQFPAIYVIKYSLPGDKEHYSLADMMIWATVPYAVWQLSYHFLITVRRREKIAAGRPTSFTWLRRSYAKTSVGRVVLSLPHALQEPAFMLIQYLYAEMTMLPCPIWFWNRWMSAAFLLVVFTWSVYNGATFYIDVFGTRFQKELEQLKSDVAKWQSSPDLASSALPTPKSHEEGASTRSMSEPAATAKTEAKEADPSRDGVEKPGIDLLPPLDVKQELDTPSGSTDRLLATEG